MDTPIGYDKRDELSQALKSMNDALNSNQLIPVSSKAIESVKKAGRPTIMTEEMQKRIIDLAEEYFFIRSIAGKAGVSVDTIERELVGRSDENREANKDFALAFAYARNKFIAYHQQKMMEYATNKREADWRAEAHILTLCDKEFSERKYLTEAVANQDAKILMLIKAEKLTIASQQGQEMLKTVIDTPLQGQEAISLLPFKPEDPKNKGKAKTLKNKGENGSRTPSQ